MRQNYEPPIQDKDYDEEMGKRVLERAKQVVAAESKSQGKGSLRFINQGGISAAVKSQSPGPS